MILDLSAKQHTQLFFSNILGTLRLDGRVPVRVERDQEIFYANLPNRRVAIPSAKRWRNYKRGWERRLQKLMKQFGCGDVVKLYPGDTVIDVGANIGEFSIAAASLGTKVHAIEGDPLVLKCLRENTWGEQNITVHPNVVWKEDTQLTFYLEPTEANSSAFAPMGDAVTRALAVDALCLDTLADKAGLDQVAFLKCDAEGAEPEVIEGATMLLSRTKTVAFDTGAERLGEETSAECERLLKSMGFSVFHQWRLHRKITFGVRS